jgi:hypothetical protein
VSTIPDRYEIYYADKLWNLLPAVYRTADTDRFESDQQRQRAAPGPLRELVNRIGAQAAILRRDLDRLWENESIEVCDDWVIAYLGDLVATNLVASLDARGQRIDVAKTIYYRRRKGTVAVLEELAHDITGWDARVVEFFRRLGRTRHGLDPAIGVPIRTGDDVDRLQKAEGLRGVLTRTGIGGFADLRNVYGALQTGTAFDEYFHTADVRAPAGKSGWYAIPRLGVFLWRLQSFPVGPGTPVAVAGCPGWFTFDPTGRDTPLFAASRTLGTCTAWRSPDAAEVAGPISQTMFDMSVQAANQRDALYPQPITVFSPFPPPGEIVPLSRLLIRPERGRFKVLPAAAPDPFPAPYWASYNYGFSSAIGASPTDRRLDTVPIPTPAPPVAVSGGGLQLAGLAASNGTVTLGDSLTYTAIADLFVNGVLTVRAANQVRPVLRIQSDWTLTGAAGQLALDGLLISGADVILAGTFDRVTISCSTFDPGNTPAAPVAGVMVSPPLPVPISPSSPPGSPGGAFALAADGRPLRPTRIWVEGVVRSMTIDRSILASVRTRTSVSTGTGGEGLIETLTISNSILQAIPTASGLFTADQLKDPARLIRLLAAADDPVSRRLRALSPALDAALGLRVSPPPVGGSPLGAATLEAVLDALNSLMATGSIYDAAAFSQVALSAATVSLLGPAADPLTLNRHLLEDAYPLELADACIATADGIVDLSRTTVMGRLTVHELNASECILQDLAVVDDIQQGCVRFTAWANGSALPRKYESVSIVQLAPLFTSDRFGEPGYAQLHAGVDSAILPAATTNTPQNTISSGAQNGSEMGAFARENNPIKESALLIKYQEFMPAGLVPVPVYVT